MLGMTFYLLNYIVGCLVILGTAFYPLNYIFVYLVMLGMTFLCLKCSCFFGYVGYDILSP